MEDFIVLRTHHSGEFVDGDLRVYEGGKIDELKVDLDRWSYFELIGTLKDLGYKDFEKIYYNVPKFGMNSLNDDAGALEIVDFHRVHLGVDIYIQHKLDQPGYYDGPIEAELGNGENVNEGPDVVEDMLSKLYEEAVNENDTYKEAKNVGLDGPIETELDAQNVGLEHPTSTELDA
ncbi:unnamed protein product [Lathyrus sativus]|nr:unnamed protein product [Lathyrus sativus]